VLTDGTVTLRALRASDAPALQEQAVDPEMVRWTNVPVPHTEAMAELFCTTRAEQVWTDGSEWILALEVDGRYAGNLALRDEGHGVAEVAFAAHPSARGSGAMERGLRLLLAWGFEEASIQTVVWRATVGNWASRRLAWKVGFGVDGVLRASHVFRGELVDAWVGTLTATDPRRPRRPWLLPGTLDGDGVRLRAYRDDDVPRIVEACSDPRTAGWLGRMPAPYTERDACDYLQVITAQQAEGRGCTWAVADPRDDRLLGSATLFDWEPDVECEIGWWVHPAERGRGVATEAARRLASYAFDELRVTRVRAVAATGNAASRHVCESVGMRHTGTERTAVEVRDGRADAALYDVLIEEWRSLRR